MNKKNEIANYKRGKNQIDEIEHQGKMIMDELESRNIKNAEFNDGTVFKKTKSYRTIATKDTMMIETDDEIIVRRKKKPNSKNLIASNPPKQTQKTYGAYNGVSQSQVSRKKKK